MDAGQPGDQTARTRAILESAPNAIMTVDQNGVIESVNPAALTCFGCQAKDIINQHVEQFIPNLAMPTLLERPLAILFVLMTVYSIWRLGFRPKPKIFQEP